jgi:hypothetical protein
MPILEQVRWPKDRKMQFATWITSELLNTEGDRTTLDKKWSDEIVQWRAALPKTQKDFPWPGASNLEFPLTAMHSDPVYADFMQTLHMPEEYWSVVANRPDRVDYAHPMTEFFKRVEQQYVKMRTVNSRALLDNNILGTAVYKNHWLYERKKVRDYEGEGVERKVAQKVKIRSHPFVEPVPLQHFWIPADAWDIDPDAPIGGARWVAQEIYLTRNQLIARATAESPFAPNYDKEAVAKIIAFETEIQNTVDAKIREQEQFQPFKERKIRLYEVWARFDVDGDDVDEDVVVLVHRETQTVVRALYMPFLHGGRPFFRTRYLPTFGFYGLGLAEADRWAQLTATKLLNAIVDNVMLSNMQMFTAPRGSGIQPGEPIYPSKIWMVGPDEEIKALPMGQVRSDIFQTLGQVLQFSDQRVSVSELRQGDISNLPSRTPATSLMSVLREGNKRFDMILADFREVHGRMGTQMVQNLGQWYQEDPVRWQKYCRNVLGDEDAQKVIETLSGSIHELPEEFGINVTATSAAVNKEIEKQEFVGLLQILADVYRQLIETAAVLQNPQTPAGTPVYETAAAAYASGVELMGRLLEKFDVQNPREYLGNIEGLASQLQSQGAQPGMQSLGAPLAAPMGGAGAPPMDLSAMMGQI